MIEQQECTTITTESDTLIKQNKLLILLLKYMKIIGANTSSSSSKGLTTPRQIQQLEAAYHKTNGEIVSSWRVGYFVAQKGGCS
jgi:hypothetical protein